MPAAAGYARPWISLNFKWVRIPPTLPSLKSFQGRGLVIFYSGVLWADTAIVLVRLRRFFPYMENVPQGDAFRRASNFQGCVIRLLAPLVTP